MNFVMEWDWQHGLNIRKRRKLSIMGRYKENWKTYNIVFMVIMILVSVPYVFCLKQSGLDNSWIYVLNTICASRQYTFGKDIVFTYGPLGFLNFCTKEGTNILVASFVWASMLIIHIVLLYQYFFKLKKGEEGKAVFLGVLLYTIADLPWNEYYICYIALFSIMLALNGYKKNIYIFTIILAGSLYIKFSLFMMVSGLFAVYLLFGYFYDKSLYKYCAIRMLIGFCCSPLIYFAISGFSLINFKDYIKGSMEIASGYNVAMSIHDNDVYIIWILVAMLAFLACIMLTIKCGMYNFMVMAFVGSCLLMSYKHGFVRSDHMRAALNGMLIFLSIIPAFLKWDKIHEIVGRRKALYIILLSVVFSIAVIQNGFDSINVVNRIRNRVFELPVTLKNVLDQEVENINPLPKSMLEEIGDASVTIYPWEISYCMSNDLNYVPLTTLQAYSTYTPYLDKMSATKIWSDNAPKYIIFSLDTIDNRWPLIECPQTWEAIRNNYFIQLQEGDLFLLKRQNDTDDVKYDLVQESEFSLDDAIELNDCDYVKIFADLNIAGKLAKIFWKIPEVNMHVFYSDGTEATHRVLLDMLSEGAEIGAMATTNEVLIDILNDTGHMGVVDKIAFEGKGIKFYRKNIKIEFYKSLSNGNLYPNENIKTNYAEEILDVDPSGFEIREEAVKYTVDFERGNQFYQFLTGWAFISDIDLLTDDCIFAVEVDGRFYKCDRTIREDVKEYFNLPVDRVGYSVIYNSGEKGNMCIIDMEHRIIYKTK